MSLDLYLEQHLKEILRFFTAELLLSNCPVDRNKEQVCMI